MNYLQKYQEHLGLSPDGIMGPNTAKAMMADLGITDKLLFAHVIGQVAHESGLYTHFRENLNYNEAGLLNIFSKYYKPTPSLAALHARKPELIANHVYANRMGNGDEASGDGWRYRGIFGLQLTGKTNITKFLDSIGLPADTDLDSLKDNPKVYFQAAFYWFNENAVDKKCVDTSDSCILTVTKRVNGGTNGLDDRKVQTRKVFKALGLA
jgi:putative chitinase